MHVIFVLLAKPKPHSHAGEQVVPGFQHHQTMARDTVKFEQTAMRRLAMMQTIDRDAEVEGFILKGNLLGVLKAPLKGRELLAVLTRIEI